MTPYQNLELNSKTLKAIQKMAGSLQLTLIIGTNTEGNICFAQNNEVRAEYKEIVSEIEILDYCYALYHSSKFRDTKATFQKLDFSQFPLPQNNSKFWKLVSCGAKLRQLQSQESIAPELISTQFPIQGNNKVSNPTYRNSSSQQGSNPKGDLGKVFINETQYFENVPVLAWNFTFGNEQPAQKWLQDRKDNELSLIDIIAYQKLIFVLIETGRIIEEIDAIEF